MNATQIEAARNLWKDVTTPEQPEMYTLSAQDIIAAAMDTDIQVGDRVFGIKRKMHGTIMSIREMACTMYCVRFDTGEEAILKESEIR